MSRYRIGRILFYPDQPNAGAVLEEAYKAKVRPMCLCKGEPGLPMYIAHIGNGYYLKRMPNTGKQHAVGCASWDMPDEFSGRIDLFGGGISFEGDTMLLRLAFPLSKQGTRITEELKQAPAGDKLSVNNGGKRLSLQGLLHMLWDEAGLNKWQGCEPDRKWDYVYHSLNLAVEGKVVKQHPLSRFVYVPEPFIREKHEEQEAARRKRFIEFAIHENQHGHQLMLLIGELKKIEECGSGGFRALIKHVPDFPFLVNGHLYKRIEKNYGNEKNIVNSTENQWSHQIVAATFSVMPEGPAEVEEISYMPVNAQWIPFNNIYEHNLLAKLIADKRSFIRPLRYNRLKSVLMPSMVLTDTGSAPTALYVVAPGQDLEKIERDSLEVDYAKWFWNTIEQDTVPDLPKRLEAAEDERENAKRASPAPSHPFIRQDPAQVVPGTTAVAPAPRQVAPPAEVTLEPEPLPVQDRPPTAETVGAALQNYEAPTTSVDPVPVPAQEVLAG